MTLDELRAWLAAGLGTDAVVVSRVAALAEAAATGDAAALRTVQDLKVSETVIVEKYDKTRIVEPGIDGLRPFETVVAEFENGRTTATTTVAREKER